MTRRVFVTRGLPGDALERLRAVADVDVWPEPDPPPRDVLRARVAGADGLLCLLTDRIDAEVLDAAPELRVVANLAVGFDNLDLAELTRRGIPAGNTPGVLTDATADLAWALILATRRRLVEATAAVRDGRWRTWDPTFMLGHDVAGSTLGIVGYGRIGAAVARRAIGFEMGIVAWSRRTKPGEPVEWVVDLHDLLRRSDVVSLHCALTPETRHLIGARELAEMKQSAVLVNTARGELVDQGALHDALRGQRIFAAGLDVVEEEPIPRDDPLLALPNCIVLPHIGSASTTARARMADLAVENLIAGFAGERLPHCVNPEVYG